MPAKFYHDLVSSRFPHRFLGQVAGPITAQTVGPEGVGTMFLTSEMRLVEINRMVPRGPLRAVTETQDDPAARPTYRHRHIL